VQTVELRARILVADNKADEALELVKSELAKQPADSEAYFDWMGYLAASLADIADDLDRRGRTVEAEKLAVQAETMYRQYVDHRPKQVLLLAEFLGKRLRMQDALDLCERAWKVSSPEETAGACVALLAGGRPDDSQRRRVRAWIEAALEQQPNSAELTFQSANAARLEGDFQRAESLYRKTVELAPQSTVACNELALLLALRREDLPLALETINRALEIAGPVPFMLDTRATVELALGQSEAAIKDLETAIVDSPTPTKYFHLAQAILAAGDSAAAKTAFRKGLASGLYAETIHPLEQDAFRALSTRLQ
jgi:tetratricopeptide (TPR) repeat protein